MGNILPNTAPAAVSEAEEVARALSVPFGTPRLSEIVRSGEKIVIVTSDITRPVPSKIIIPRLLDELGKAGVKDEDVTIVFGLGSHRKQTEEEQKSLVGEEVYSRVKCVDSDPEDCVHLGVAGMVRRWIYSVRWRKRTDAFWWEMWNTIILQGTAAA